MKEKEKKKDNYIGIQGRGRKRRSGEGKAQRKLASYKSKTVTQRTFTLLLGDSSSRYPKTI